MLDSDVATLVDVRQIPSCDGVGAVVHVAVTPISMQLHMESGMIAWCGVVFNSST